MGYEEKDVLPPQEKEVEQSQESTELQWSEAEEKALVRKIDFIIMPLLILGFFALQLDRGNISNALTDNFLKDVGVVQNDFNTGQQLLAAGIVALEIPSNLVLYKVGPTIWIGGQIIVWGFVAVFQAFQKGLGPFMATRLLLGLCESGFIPAGLYTLSRWYKRDEISKRFALFFLGNSGSSALSGIIAFGILRMRGIANLAGWQWLFILEGIFTILVGIAILATFPQSISNPVSLLKMKYFTKRESQVLYERVIRDDPTKATAKSHVQWKEFKSALTNWRLIPHICLTISGLAPVTSIGTYAPTLVNGFGFGALQSNAMVSIGAWGVLITSVFWGWASDKIGVRGPMVTFALVIAWIFNIANRTIIESTNKYLRFGLLVTYIGFGWTFHPVNGSWLALNAKSAGERSVIMAIHIMSANCGGIVGGQIFRSEDSPVYRTGWTAIICLSSAAVVFSIIANLQYYFGNGRKLARSGLPFAY